MNSLYFSRVAVFVVFAPRLRVILGVGRVFFDSWAGLIIFIDVAMPSLENEGCVYVIELMWNYLRDVE